MAFGTRLVGVTSLAAAMAVAATLAGVAVFTASGAGCPEPGHYVTHGDQIELVGGCVNPAELPAAPAEDVPARSGDGIDPLRQAP